METGVQAAAFRMLAWADSTITEMLHKVCDDPVKIIAAGVSMFAASFTLVWGIYKCYNILIGLEPQPLLPFFKDLAFKLIIFAIVCFGTSGIGQDFSTYVKDPLLSVGRNFAQDIIKIMGKDKNPCEGTQQADTQNDKDSVVHHIFTDMDCRIAKVMAKFEENQAGAKPETDTQKRKREATRQSSPLYECFYDVNGEVSERPPADYKVPERMTSVNQTAGVQNNNRDYPSTTFLSGGRLKIRTREELGDRWQHCVDMTYSNLTYLINSAEANIRAVNKEIQEENEFGVWDWFIFFLQKLIVAIGFLVLGISMFVVVLTNQVFLQICISVAPLFIFFAAFDSLRKWFNNWLNITLGYCFAYPFVLIAVGGLMATFGTLNDESISNGDFVLTWANVGMMFFLCLIYAIFMARIGGLAAQMFGGNQIAAGAAEQATDFAGTHALTDAVVPIFVGSERTRNGYRDRETGKSIAPRYGGIAGLGISGWRATKRWYNQLTVDDGDKDGKDNGDVKNDNNKDKKKPSK